MELNYNSETLTIDGNSDISGNAVFPDALFVSSVIFPTYGYMTGIKLSTSFENPNAEILAVAVGIARGNLGNIYLGNYQGIYEHHISASSSTVALTSGVGWPLAEAPLVSDADRIAVWIANSNDGNVVIDAIMSVIWVPYASMPTELRR